MEGLITYMVFISVMVAITAALFRYAGNFRVERSKHQSGGSEPVGSDRNYWDFCLVGGMGVILLGFIFLSIYR